jgi:hypothetical protein
VGLVRESRCFTVANTKNKLHLRRGALLSGRNVLMFQKNTCPVSAVKMLVARSSKMAVHLYQTTQTDFPRDILRSYFMFPIFWIFSINTSGQITRHDVCVPCSIVLRCLKISLVSQLRCCCRRPLQQRNVH